MRCDIETIKRCRVLARRHYNRLRDDYRYSGHVSHAASEALRLAGEELKIGYGVEGFCLDVGGREGVSYLNMGDTYDATVLFDSRHERFVVTSWGDKVETLEREGITLP